MPIYEFKCNTCEHVFEELVPMNTEGDLLKCPACGAVGTKRQISVFAAHGLENGHIGVGWKLTGNGSGSPSEGSSAPAKGSCGPGCSCGGH